MTRNFRIGTRAKQFLSDRDSLLVVRGIFILPLSEVVTPVGTACRRRTFEHDLWFHVRAENVRIRLVLNQRAVFRLLAAARSCKREGRLAARA